MTGILVTMFFNEPFGGLSPALVERRVELEESVRTRLGNDCDVLVFTRAEFDRLAFAGEPVVSDVLHDGCALIGAMPRVERGGS